MPSPSIKPRRSSGAFARSDVKKLRTCFFCSEKVEQVESQDVRALRHMTSKDGKIRSRRSTGMCRRHQNQLGAAVKRAREMSLLPYVNG